jgi:very-short-patch-repair endonuclease
MTIEFPEKPFTLPMARELGISRKRVAAAVREGVLQRTFHGVYLRADVELTTAAKAAAAALVVSPHAVLCDRTAAWIWGVDCFRYRELDVVPALDAFTFRGHRAPQRQQVRGGERDLSSRDWVIVDGVRVTTPLRTALDLGCRLNRRDALAAIDALMRAHGLVRADLARCLPRFAGRRGVVQLRELVGLADPRAESSGESWTRLEILDRGLPSPEVQWWVVVGGKPKYRLDLAYPHAKIAIEYNGEEFHSSDVDIAAFAERRDWLERHGWTVIVVDKASFTEEAAQLWIEQIRQLLALAQTPPRRWFVRH